MSIAMDLPDLGTAPDELSHGTAIRSQGSERVSWTSPAQGLWVAETPTAYLGMVDRNHDGFVATSFDGQELGVFPSRSGAQLAVYGHWFSTAIQM
jgi:hypothetical protein